jgi:hypothetical protein
MRKDRRNARQEPAAPKPGPPRQRERSPSRFKRPPPEVVLEPGEANGVLITDMEEIRRVVAEFKRASKPKPGNKK